jgi:hypothetical protein
VKSLPRCTISIFTFITLKPDETRSGAIEIPYRRSGDMSLGQFSPKSEPLCVSLTFGV